MAATPDYPYRKRHQKTHKFDKIDVDNIYVREDMIILGDFTFGNAAFDTLVLKGRTATGSAAGTAVEIDATTCTYSEGLELRYTMVDWADVATFTSAKGMYLRMESTEANASGSIYGMELYGVANNVNTQGVWGLLSYAYAKGASAKTISYMYAVQPELTWDAGSTTCTLSTEAICVRAKITGGKVDDYTKIHGVQVKAGDMNGASPKYGNAFWVIDDADMSGTTTWTRGLYVNVACTTGVDVAGACTTGVLVGGATTTAISITGATTTAIATSGTSGSATGRVLKGAMTVNNAAYGDGYGLVESELTLSGTVANHVAALTSWINMPTVTTGANYVCAQSNGLWSDSGGVLTNGTFIFGMRAQCLLQTNGGASGAEFYPFSVVNNTNVTTAVFQCNAASSDLGLTTDAGSDDGTLVPFYKDNTGVHYVKIYSHT